MDTKEQALDKAGKKAMEMIAGGAEQVSITNHNKGYTKGFSVINERDPASPIIGFEYKESEPGTCASCFFFYRCDDDVCTFMHPRPCDAGGACHNWRHCND
jgi:hypothetical protein